MRVNVQADLPIYFASANVPATTRDELVTWLQQLPAEATIRVLQGSDRSVMRASWDEDRAPDALTTPVAPQRPTV